MLNGGWDHTYEYLTYRQREAWGTLRSVEEDSVREADNVTYPFTWDTVDIANNSVVCVPNGPDPVLYGIRGDIPEEAIRTGEMIRCEPIERSALYRTNQGTDMHLIPIDSIREIEEMHSYIIQGKVVEEPRTIKGGHVIFSINDLEGNQMDCAAYEPTKNFRELVRKLIPEDKLVLCGSVKNMTLNIEKMEITDLAQKYSTHNPQCPSCKKSMKSAGSGQGYRCKKCGTKEGSTVSKALQRDIETGIYEVPPCARRHLAKPLVRLDEKDLKVFPSR
jgi:tRNA(Ile2)-agmatinylcytidine synthase